MFRYVAIIYIVESGYEFRIINTDPRYNESFADYELDNGVAFLAGDNDILLSYVLSAQIRDYEGKLLRKMGRKILWEEIRKQKAPYN